MTPDQTDLTLLAVSILGGDEGKARTLDVLRASALLCAFLGYLDTEAATESLTGPSESLSGLIEATPGGKTHLTDAGRIRLASLLASAGAPI